MAYPSAYKKAKAKVKAKAKKKSTVKKRRTPAQIAATKKLVALNKKRRAHVRNTVKPKKLRRKKALKSAERMSNPRIKHSNYRIVKSTAGRTVYFTGTGFGPKARGAIYHSKPQALHIAELVANKTRSPVYVQED